MWIWEPSLSPFFLTRPASRLSPRQPHIASPRAPASRHKPSRGGLLVVSLRHKRTWFAHASAAPFCYCIPAGDSRRKQTLRASARAKHVRALPPAKPCRFSARPLRPFLPLPLPARPPSPRALWRPQRPSRFLDAGNCPLSLQRSRRRPVCSPESGFWVQKGGWGLLLLSITASVWSPPRKDPKEQEMPAPPSPRGKGNAKGWAGGGVAKRGKARTPKARWYGCRSAWPCLLEVTRSWSKRTPLIFIFRRKSGAFYFHDQDWNWAKALSEGSNTRSHNWFVAKLPGLKLGDSQAIIFLRRKRA